ncbi:MAG TPA: EAL domain-containing protein [Acidimicrobiia bacterium]|nr:EAL domain-containing protein [Acidimicrobiia bacterium]
MTGGHDREHQVAIIGFAFVVVCLLGASVVFANSAGTTLIAEDAEVQVRAQGMIGTIAVSRAIFSEALVLAVAGRQGQPTEENLEAVLEDADGVLLDLRSRTSTLATVLDDVTVEQAMIQFIASAATLLENLRAGDIEAAQGENAAQLDSAFVRATELLVAERDAREKSIAAVRAGVGDVANAVRFVVAFFVPVTAITWAMAVMRRRQRRLRLEADIAQEETLRAAKDEFLAAVAHELRTPLTAVVGFAETLRDQTRRFSAKDRDELVDILADQATHTAAIVEDLLVFARTNIGDLRIRPENVQGRDLVEKAALAWAASTSPSLTVIGEAEVRADPSRLRQVIRNLIANAFDQGGNKVEVRIIQTGPIVVIEVADDGPGVPVEDRSEIFEPFKNRTRRNGLPANLGLGLSVARSLVRLMDGELSYFYRQGENVFEVSLPAAESVPRLQLQLEGESKSPIDWPTAAQVLDVIANNRFEIVYQPIVDLHHPTGDRPPIGWEALSRFTSGIPPAWFSAAAHAGLGIELQLATIRAAIDGFQRMPQGPFLALNVSMETLASPRLPDALLELPASRVVLELSEDTVVDDYTRAKVYVDRLVRRGYRIAFDDLARGRIDPWHLVRLRPAIVKIDISMVQNIDQDPNKRAQLNAIKWLSEVLRSRIVAEGIERPEELETITRLGVHYGQGYLLGYPGSLPTDTTLTPVLATS